MKKLVATCALALMISTPAAAQNMMMKPYIGFDLQRMVVDYNESIDAGGGNVLNGDTLLEDSLDGFNIHAGNRFHQNFGLELGYFRTREEEKSISAGTTVGPGLVATGNFSTDVQVQGITLDALGYIPLDQANRFELIGTAGLSWSKADVEITIPGVGSADEDESEFGFRVGAGAQFNFTENVNMRGLVRYQTADFDDVVDNLWFYTVGLNFSF